MDPELKGRASKASSSRSSGSSANVLGPSRAAGSASGGRLASFARRLVRKKPLDEGIETDLNRCLNLVDLTALGVGSTLGLGLYVLAGEVASQKSGPAVVISFALAALASAFSALCYAEFAGRVPRAGSAYAYSYISVGELVAFVIGWNLLLEYVISASTVARGFSGYLRYVFQQLCALLSAGCAPSGLAQVGAEAPPARSLLEAVHAHLVHCFDGLSVAIVLAVTLFILLGVKESTKLTMALTLVNLVVVASVVASSLGSLNFHNWALTAAEVPAGAGSGGFMPFGWLGVIEGSSTCFFAFIGFDTIASSAEEARNPKRNVPLAILLSLAISSVAYMSIALVQTLLWPYYEQNNVTILPTIFMRLNMPLVSWIVIVGAIAGLASSQLGAFYPLPRVLFSMAQDRLVYGFLANVNRRLKLPVRATLVGAVLVAALACLLEIHELADMVSIGTLAAYNLVAISVLILRYERRPEDDDHDDDYEENVSAIENGNGNQNNDIGKPNDGSQCPQTQFSFRPPDGATVVTLHHHQQHDAKQHALDPYSKPADSSQTRGQNQNQHPNQNQAQRGHWQAPRMRQPGPTPETSARSKLLIGLVVLKTLGLNALISAPPLPGQWLQVTWASLTLCLVVALLASLVKLARLPRSRALEAANMFQVPWVPLVPALSFFINNCLMLNLSYLTWVRFSVWMALGLFIYLTYGTWKSRGHLVRLAPAKATGPKEVTAGLDGARAPAAQRRLSGELEAQQRAPLEATTTTTRAPGRR